MSTAKLYDLIDVIITEAGMRVTDEDFYGDDWYGYDAIFLRKILSDNAEMSKIEYLSDCQ